MECQGDRVFELFAQRWTKMKFSAADHPFVFERGEATWRFHLQHSSLADFMPLAQQMLLASRLPEPEAEEMLEGVCTAQEAGARFDVGHLRSPGDELVLAELPATLVTPLVGERGRLALTGHRLYFQPLHNVSGDAAVHSHPLGGLAAVARRRAAGLRDVGLEVFFAQPAAAGSVHSGGGRVDAACAPPPHWGAPSALFSFASTQERDAFLSALAQQPALGTGLTGGPDTATAAGLVLEAEGGWLGRVTSAWQRGALSNFQYLLFLNAAAGRTFNDLSQCVRQRHRVCCHRSSHCLDGSHRRCLASSVHPLGHSCPVGTPSCPGCWQTTPAPCWTCRTLPRSGTCPSPLARSTRSA